MKHTLVRKFQPPAGDAPGGDPVAGRPATSATPQAEALPAADVEIPEINTHFIDNLFTDPTFVDRFDVAFGQTVHMGLDGEVNPSAKPAAPDATHKEWENLLDITYPNSPAK